MKIRENVSLQAYNTFGIDVNARYFAEITSVDDLREIIFGNHHPLLILGGGSNMLLAGDWEGLVVKNNILGREIISKKGAYSIVAIGGGENWHELVLWALENNLGGIENLSLIPGTVGAAPIQNIGAYGVELKDVFEKLEAIDLDTGKLEIFTADDCDFGYRNSYFKKENKGKYLITKVLLKLNNQNHEIHSDYGAIQDILKAEGISDPGIKDISKAVIAIRSSKLPDPEELGNSGSFFKNPEIPRTQLVALQEQFPNIVFYELPDNMVKVPAGWLIEHAGWKGRRVGNTGSHEKQALVLVNYGGATGKEVWDLALAIQQSVREKYGIMISPEVNVIGA